MTYGGVEAGGTKFICALGTGSNDVQAQTRIPTTTPEETLRHVAAFFEEQPEKPEALGIGSFGPVDPRPGSPTYGFITSTPKEKWQDTDVAGALHEALDIPVAFDTDVNAAALGEHRWGAAQNVETFLYLTIGTGIGGGAIIHGKRLHGLLHPEMGHLRIPQAPSDAFEGSCPFHDNCLEGLASGPAIEARWGQPPEALPSDHPAWELEARYLAHALVNFICTLSPQRIILGGGVMRHQALFPMIRKQVQEFLNDYIKAPALLDEIDSYIVPPALGERAGVLGALALAREAA